jgi:carboxypeptidase D
LLIGNGWISPLEHYKSYLSFAYKKRLIERNSEIAQRIEAQQAMCLSALSSEKGKDMIINLQCKQVLHDILRETQKKGTDGNMVCTNMYDVRLTDTFPSCGANWPPDLTIITPYLHRQDVLDALHISSEKTTRWTECNSQVRHNFQALHSKPSITLLPDLLQEIRVVLFSGSEDLICNHLGTEEMIGNMEWNGGKGFEVLPGGTWAPRHKWEFKGETVGIYQEARNLTYVLFYNSSHMVPLDNARLSREMLHRFMNIDIVSCDQVPTSTQTSAISKWSVFYMSGGIVLVMVILSSVSWGYYIWRDQRKHTGYTGLFDGGTLDDTQDDPRGEIGPKSLVLEMANRARSSSGESNSMA